MIQAQEFSTQEKFGPQGKLAQGGATRGNDNSTTTAQRGHIMSLQLSLNTLQDPFIVLELATLLATFIFILRLTFREASAFISPAFISSSARESSLGFRPQLMAGHGGGSTGPRSAFGRRQLSSVFEVGGLISFPKSALSAQRSSAFGRTFGSRARRR